MSWSAWLLGLWLALVPSAVAGALQRIYIAGDSTASEYPPQRHPRTGWGQVLGEFFDRRIEVRNRAVSGRSTRDYQTLGHRDALIAELNAGDLLLIQFGHNDQKADDPLRFADADGAFRVGLESLVRLARGRGARPVLLTPVARRQFDAAGHAVDTHGRWAAAVRAVAGTEDVPLVDLGDASLRALEALGVEGSRGWYLHDSAIGLADDTHFHRRGALAIACLVAEELVLQRLVAADARVRDTDCGVPVDFAERRAAQPRPSRVEHAELIERVQPGPHGGPGLTIAAPFFADAPDLDLVVRQRTLHAGAGIGLHAHGKDEIWYIVRGQGELVLDGEARVIGAGHAVLTRDGSAHSLRQVGDEDLTLLVIYRKPPPG